MKTGYIILLVALLFGQLAGVTILPGVVMYVHDMVLLVLLSIRFWKIKHFVRPRLFGPIVLFSVVGLLSLFFALFKFTPWQVGQGSLYLLRWIAYASVYMILAQETTQGLFFLRGLFFTGSAFSVLGLLQYILYPNLRNLWYLGWDPHYFRLFSTFLDPNYAGLFIVLTIFLGLHINKRLWPVQIINLLALYLTYSRGSYLAFASGVVIWIVMKKQWKWLFGLPVFAVLILLPKPGGDTLRLTRVDSTVSRVENWQEATKLCMKSPLIGYGFNTLRFIPRTGETEITSHAAAGVDNSFLFLLVTTGFVGLVSYLWLLWSMRSSSPLYWAAMTTTLVHSMFTNSLFYPWILLWWWIIAGTSRSSR